MMKVFVTDASYKHTLGAVRSLGSKGIYVIAGSTSSHSLSFYSKYCSEHVVYPDPKREDEFVSFMLDYVKKNKIDVLLPISYLATTALSKHKAEFDGLTKLPVADYSSMEVAADKNQTMNFAASQGIKVPRMYAKGDDVVSYPVVVKGLMESGKVSYANSSDDLSSLDLQNSLIQEYISGVGYGFFALLNKGQPRAIFMHKRIREYPVTGGPSTVAESIYDPDLKRQGLELLQALNWHGVAMVEFKKDSRDGKFKLMEINPKFWGSLDLAIASGVDFPYLTVKMAVEGDIEPVFEYETGIRFRWLFPDDSLYLLSNPGSLGTFIRDFFHEKTKTNIWLCDIMPNILQVCDTPRQVIKRIRKGSFRYPNGRPVVKA